MQYEGKHPNATDPRSENGHTVDRERGQRPKDPTRLRVGQLVHVPSTRGDVCGEALLGPGHPARTDARLRSLLALQRAQPATALA
jgi:hypothetical protein